jgi:cell division septation protein DedD
VPQVEHLSYLAQPFRAASPEKRAAGRAPFDARRSGDRLPGHGRTRLLSGIVLLACALSLWSVPRTVAGVEPARDPISAAFGITDGDSAMAAILRAVERNPDDPRAGEALARAGFIAYCSGDAERAGQLFEMAGGAGYVEAALWRGIALLSAGDSEAAARVLREAYGELPGSSDRGTTLAMAAAKFAEGDVEGGEVICRGMMAEGDLYSAAALGLLMRSVPDAVDPDEASRLAELVSSRHPLSYEASLALRLAESAARAESEAAGADEIPIPEEEIESAPEGGEPSAVEGGEPAARAEPPAGQAPVRGEAQGGGEIAGGDVSASGPYSVQVGAFSDVRNAESLVQRLVESGYDAVRIERETKNGMLFHCVKVGHFKSAEDARSLAATLKDKESLGTRVVRKDGD